MRKMKGKHTMKRLISILVVVAMILATVAVIIPASSATKVNVMGNSDANTQFAGNGNVFYFDYHKYIALGKTFPMADGDKGAEDLMLRLGKYSGSGTASVCDGNKTSSSFDHYRGDVTINGTTYGHAFGYSFKNSVTVDEVKLYLPTDSAIESIDVYGATKSGSTYGKEAAKTYLGTFNVSSGYAGGALDEALKVDYIFFAIKFKAGTSGNYKFYEIELYGLESGAADFSALKTAYAKYKALNPAEYEPDTWANVTAALQSTDPVNKSCLSTAAQISTAATTLTNAMNTLVKTSQYKALLQEVIAQANAVDKNTCTESAYADLTTKLNAAKTALAANPFNEAAGKTAYENLRAALTALAVKVNVMGNSDANKQFAGNGNVFYFDYHKYVALGKTFPMADGDKGAEDLMLRLGKYSGGGTASVCDGKKEDGGFDHYRGDVTINGTTYGHAFGYSFKNSVTVDEVKLYLPTDSAIESIDVYGATKSGSTYGKEAAKTYLGTFNVIAGYAAGALKEAMKVDYIFFALKFKSGTSGNYKFYEIELYGLEKNFADFSELKFAYSRYNSLKASDYEPDSWAKVTAAVKSADPVNKSCFSTATEIAAAANTLNNAINSLVKMSENKILLKEAIDEAKKIDKTKCTADSYAKLEAALTAAETAFAASPFVEATGVTAYTNLKSAIAGLSIRKNVMGNSDANTQFAGNGNVFYFDYHKYIALGKTFPIADGDKGAEDLMLRLGKYSGSGTASVCDGNKTSSSFDHYRGDIIIGGTTYGHAFGYSFKSSVTVDEVKFYLPADTAVESIDVYGATQSGTTYGKEAVKTYLGTFNVSSGYAGGTLNEVMKVDYIFFAVKFKSGTSGNYKFYEIELFGLEGGAADFSDLKRAIAEFGALSADKYEAASWTSALAVLNSAKAVNTNCLSSAAHIAGAAENLRNAIKALAEKKGVKGELTNKIAEADLLVEADYLPDTWPQFKAALDAAKIVEADANATQSQVDTALANLKTAMESLVKYGDKTELEAAIAEAEALQESQYTATSWTYFKKALDEAKAVMENPLATQEEIDAIVDKLYAKTDNLVKVGDRGALEAAINAAKALKAEDYAGNSIAWGMFTKAITSAEVVLNDPNATAKEMEDAIKTIENRKAQLIATPGGSSTQPPETQAPATQAPATEAPATQAPATQAPATQAPSTQAPATQRPATQAPATQAPVTQAPATQAPATQAPATEIPTETGTEQVIDTETFTESETLIESETFTEVESESESGSESESETEADKMKVKAPGACKSTISVSAIAVVGIIGTAIVVKKKEN